MIYIAEWWTTWGVDTPDLRNIAAKILSQTTSASNCERNWSTFSLIYTKIRNRLKYKKLHTLVYIHYNMRLRLRQSLRQNQRQLEERYNPINLDYIFDEDDPLAPWLEEREQPVFDPNDISWLDDDEDGDTIGADNDPSAGTSVGIPVRLDDDDDDDDDGGGGGGGDDDGGDDDDDDGSIGPPPGFTRSGAGGPSGGHDYFPDVGSSTPPYDRYGGGGSGSGGGGHAASGSRRDKGKSIMEDREEFNVGQIGGDISSLYLHNNDYGHVHYPLPSQDSSTFDSSRYSMDYASRYGEYGQSDMASQLATSLFGGNYGHYQQPEQSEEYGYHQDPPRKSFWW